MIKIQILNKFKVMTYYSKTKVNLTYVVKFLKFSPPLPCTLLAE